jgi:hypothetical protein
MGKTFIILVFILVATNSFAQLHEVGLSIGGSNYVGDIGPTNLIRHNAPAVGLLYKYNRNPRVSYRVSLSAMKIKAHNSDSRNEIKQQFNTPVNKTITEITAGIDFNFLEYEISHWKKTHTPYLIFELAAFHYKKAIGTADDYRYKSQMGIALPLGVGYKIQVATNFIIGFETRIRYSFTDDIDDSQFYKNGILKDHPENSKFGNPDKKDWYACTGFTITYTFGRALSYTTQRH